MPTSAPSRPAAGEFFDYYGKYIALVPDGDVRAHIAHQLSDTAAYIAVARRRVGDVALRAGQVEREGSDRPPG